MQDSRELIEMALAGVKPRRTPIFDLLANDAVIEFFAGHRLDGTDDEKIVLAAAANGLDGTRAIATPNREETVWTDPAGNSRISDRWTSWLKEPAFPDIDGWAQWMRNYVDEAEQGAEERSIQLDLTEHEVHADRCSQVASDQRQYNETLNGTVNIHCTPSTAVNALLFYVGLETLTFLWADHRDLVKRWMQMYRSDTLDYIRVFAHAKTSPLAMVYSDIAYRSGTLFSPKMLASMEFFDEVAEICDTCHSRGIKVVFHSDGNIMSVLDDLVATGIDGLNPIEKAAGTDIFAIRRRHPNLTLVGGMDVTHLLRTGSREQICSETRRIITEVGAEGHLIIGSSTEVGNDIPLEKFLAFHTVAMET